MLPNFSTAARQARLAIRMETRLLSARLGRRPMVMHHGLQRSGTNFLLLALVTYGVPVINYRDPARNNPRHKHFRWQPDKQTIPGFIADQYGNTLNATGPEQLRAICGLSDHAVSVVIRKRREEWLKSICNWGLRCGWFDDVSDALANLPTLVEDWHAFHGFWDALSESEPGRVAVLGYDEIVSDPNVLVEGLRRVGVVVRNPDAPIGFAEVPQSPQDRRQLVTLEDIENTMRL